MKPNNKNLKPINLGCIQEFPFIDETFDSITYYQMLQKLSCKTNEIIKFVNDVIENKVVEYIDKRFNDIMIDSMYDAETETLILYLSESEG